MELDVGQIDLLDLPLPPSSKQSLDQEELRVSKGPPPLPPLLPPEEPPAADAPEAKAEGEKSPPVPSLPPPPEPRVSQPAAISARKLVDGPPSGSSSLTRFLVGMGAASLVCVGGFFAYSHFHKAPSAPAPAASAAPEATHAFTMAPVEFTDPAPSASESAAPSAVATAAPGRSAAPAPTTTATAPSHASVAAPHPTHAPSTKPPDDLIKVEN